MKMYFYENTSSPFLVVQQDTAFTPSLKVLSKISTAKYMYLTLQSCLLAHYPIHKHVKQVIIKPFAIL
jgi:hypothetical protein